MAKNIRLLALGSSLLVIAMFMFVFSQPMREIVSYAHAATITPKIYEKNGKVWLENAKFKAGFNLTWGASLSDLVVGGVEVVNRHDPGREVQIALYDGNHTYDSCAGCTGVFGWDPVQGGDKYGHGSKVITKSISPKIFYAKIRPIQWYPDDKGGGKLKAIDADVYIEQWVSFVDNNPEAFKIHYKITHFGTDSHAVARQELPAIYVNKDFSTFVYYNGNAPWTNSAVSKTTFPTLSSTTQFPQLYSSESWGALVKGSNNVGLSVFTPGQQYYHTGFHANGNGTTGPTGDVTNYFSPFVYYAFEPNSVLEGDMYLVSGNYTRARQIIYGLKNTIAIPHMSYPLSSLDSPQKDQQISSSNFTVSGWVYDALSPVTAVQIYIDNVYNGNATYFLSRPDVVAKFASVSQNSGFSYALDTTKLANGKHTVTVKVTTADNKNVTIANTPVNIDNAGLPIGYFDSASCSMLTGWTCDSNNYAAPLDVHFYKDAPYEQGGTFVGMTKADIVREAGVSSMCGGVAAHGFAYQTPASLQDNIAHAIYAYAINVPQGSNPILSQSPQTIQCSGQ